MRLVVCGGAGFIGSNIVRRRLAQTDDAIVVLGKLTYAGNLINLADVEGDPALASRYRFVKDDITGPKAVRQQRR